MVTTAVSPLQRGGNQEDVEPEDIAFYHHSPLLSSFFNSNTNEVSTPFASSNETSSDDKTDCTAMIILNAPISTPPSPLFQRLWHQASFHVCADGGANRLLRATTTKTATTTITTDNNSNNNGSSATIDDDDATSRDNADPVENTHTNTKHEQFIPNTIAGDLDSLQLETRQYYERRGVKIKRDPYQDSNDIDKAVQAVVQHFETQARIKRHPKYTTTFTSSSVVRCIVYGAFGGRFDQEMASLQILYQYANVGMQLFLYNDQTMAFLLPAGKNYIYVATTTTTTTSSHATLPDRDCQDPMVYEGPTCGLIPLGCPVECVTTSGLQWNLNGQRTAFGDLVSTSNCIVDTTVIPFDNRNLTKRSTDDINLSQATDSFPTMSDVMVQCSQPLIFTAQIHSGSTSDWTE